MINLGVVKDGFRKRKFEKRMVWNIQRYKPSFLTDIQLCVRWLFTRVWNYEKLWSLTTCGRLWRQIPVVKDRWFWMDARLLELIASQKDTPINFLKPDSILGWETKIDNLFKDDTIFKREAKNITQAFLKSLSLYSKE